MKGLTPRQRRLCKMLQVSVEAFLAVRDGEPQPDEALALHSADMPGAERLTDRQQMICEKLGVSPEQFLAAKGGGSDLVAHSSIGPAVELHSGRVAAPLSQRQEALCEKLGVSPEQFRAARQQG
ncbi:MAG: hypothetical protein R6X33_00200 [Candidatus Brocadiia bacterium]